MTLTQRIIETNASIRTVLNHSRLTFFLAIALLMLSSTVTNAQDDGVSWKVQLDTANSGKIAITVNPMNMKGGLYVTSMKCTVRFFDANGDEIGAREFNFSSVSPGSLFAKTPPKKKLFTYPFRGARSVKGDDMTYRLFREGGKADGGFVKKGKVSAVP
jgi:hypothetical protein